LNPTTRASNAHFFSGNYAPLTEEHDIAALETTGTFPPELSGTLYRVGPSPQYAPRDDNYHWFSGDGMVHAFHVAGGKVAYSNRWARTPKWQLEHEAGRALFGTFGNPATSDPMVHGRNGGTANTSMLWHGGRLFALEESHQPFELDAHTLASKGHQSFGDRLTSRCTAHPKVDPESGELHFFAYSPDGPGTPGMLYGVMDAECEVTQLQAFDAPYASMAHDFMLTRAHVLFPVMPLTTSVERAMQGKPLLAWDASKRTHVGVMRRGATADTMRWFDTDACHVFHVMNAWDDGDAIVACVMQSDTAPGLPDAEGRPGDPHAMAARLCRWTFVASHPYVERAAPQRDRQDRLEREQRRPPSRARAAPGHASITTPPTQAPSALPRLKAAMFRLDARFWPAPEAFSSTRSCIGATVANEATPSRPTNTTAVNGVPMVNCIAPSTTASATSVPSTAGIGARSASLPPRMLPMARPPPNTSRIGDTADSLKPVTCVSSGWM
jgi:carotenoid cleavage dioxygenase-like enzyme